jgi:hypothetical protein
MTLKKTEDTGNGKGKHLVAVCVDIALEEATHLSQDRLQSECYGM